MTGKDLVDFITSNKLEESDLVPYSGCLTWSVFLDEEHTIELEYNFNYDGDLFVRKLVWSAYNEDGDVDSEETEVSFEEALELRGLA